MKSLDGRMHIVYNSNKLIGTFVEHAYSPNGEYCAFTISAENPNAHKILVIDVRTGKPVEKCLQIANCKKIAWSGDSHGFFVYVNINVSVLVIS